jgi:hypothetical protein
VNHRVEVAYSGPRVLWLFLLGSFVFTWGWLALGLPRASRSRRTVEVPVVIEDGASLLPGVNRRELERRLLQFHEDTGVEFQIFTQMASHSGASLSWKQKVTQTRLLSLPDGQPRILLLVSGAVPFFDLRWNQGLETALDSEFLARLLETQISPMLRRGRMELAIGRAVAGISERIRSTLRDPEGAWSDKLSPWPRRYLGHPAEEWHRVTEVGLLTLAGIILLGMLASPTARAQWWGPGRWRPKSPSGPFQGGATSGGFGGVARGGGLPPPAW